MGGGGVCKGGIRKLKERAVGRGQGARDWADPPPHPHPVTQGCLGRTRKPKMQYRVWDKVDMDLKHGTGGL